MHTESKDILTMHLQLIHVNPSLHHRMVALYVPVAWLADPPMTTVPSHAILVLT